GSDIRWLREKRLFSDSARSGGGSSQVRRYAPAIVAVLAIGALFYAQWKPTRHLAWPVAQPSPGAVAPAAPMQDRTGLSPAAENSQEPVKAAPSPTAHSSAPQGLPAQVSPGSTPTPSAAPAASGASPKSAQPGVAHPRTAGKPEQAVLAPPVATSDFGSG